jgi:predicted LPLAT superfamily acyltransferase
MVDGPPRIDSASRQFNHALHAAGSTRVTVTQHSLRPQDSLSTGLTLQLQSRPGYNTAWAVGESDLLTLTAPPGSYVLIASCLRCGTARIPLALDSGDVVTLHVHFRRAPDNCELERQERQPVFRDASAT